MNTCMRWMKVNVMFALVLLIALGARAETAETIGFRYTPLVVLALAAEDEAAASEGDELTALLDAINNGKITINIRARLETADVDGFGFSNAITVRTRLGYGTQSYNGVSGYIEFEDIRAVDEDQYNAAGLNAQPGKSVIADPEDTEVNQAFVKIETGERLPVPVTIIGGRQRIVLDDARFIGNVGWRQNEQTFDAISLKTTPIDDVTVFYAYLWDINRIFGPDSNRDFESDSHLINVAWTGCPGGTLVLFGYFFDFDNSPASSSDTFGVRWVGKHKVDEDTSVGYILSYAKQEDAADNTTNYDADYYLAEVSVTRDKVTGGAGYEVLGSDSSMASFMTPLATGHKFNGWADAFLTTPPGGLEDLYIFVGAPLPYGAKGKIVFHWFDGEDSGGDLGNELDVVVSKAINQHVAVLAKYAHFDGQSGGADIKKFWLQVEVKN